MAQLSYSFCMSLLHSFWQAGVLLLIYILTERSLHTTISPLQKRNWLFVLLAAQVSFFVITFFIYYLNIENAVTENVIGQTVTGILSTHTIALITPWLFTAYVAAITYKMTKALYEWYRFKKQYNGGLQKPSVDLKLFTKVKAHHFGIKRKVTLWLSTTINTPVTFGFFKPVIVLPVALANNISMQQAETLILHELTHIKANDYLLNWALIIAENIFFFNPFINIICKKIRLEREKYCDSNVITFQYPPLLYAETLLQAQYVKQHTSQYQLAAVTGKAQLLQRIQFFTNAKNFSHKRSSLVLPLFSLLFVSMFAATVFFQYRITAKAKEATAANITPPVYYTTSDETALPKMVTNIIETFSDARLKEIASTVEKQRPALEAKLKSLEPFIKSVQENAEKIAQQFDDNNIVATPVSFNETPNIPSPAPATVTRKVVIKEEQSGSKDAVLKVYTVSLIDGQWVVVPDWILAAKEIPDSLRLKMDTSLPPVQE